MRVKEFLAKYRGELVIAGIGAAIILVPISVKKAAIDNAARYLCAVSTGHVQSREELREEAKEWVLFELWSEAHKQALKRDIAEMEREGRCEGEVCLDALVYDKCDACTEARDIREEAKKARLGYE